MVPNVTQVKPGFKIIQPQVEITFSNSRTDTRTTPLKIN